MSTTTETTPEPGALLLAARTEQGLPPTIQDKAALAVVARILRGGAQ